MGNGYNSYFPRVRVDKPLFTAGRPYYAQHRQPPFNGVYYPRFRDPSIHLIGDYPGEASVLLPWPRELPTVRQQIEQAALAAGIDPNRFIPGRFSPRVRNNPNSRATFRLPPLPRLPLPQIPFQRRRIPRNRRPAVLVPY